MKIVISPSKALDYSSKIPTQKSTCPQFIEKSKEIHKYLKDCSPKELSDLMHISENLSNLNWERNQNRKFIIDKLTQRSRQAIYAFNGDVYEGIDAYHLPLEAIDFLQVNLRMLSGLYGYLRPLDIIEPYRLEMGVKFPVAQAKDLYAFWKETLSRSLENEMQEDEVLINLASNEYFSAIDKKTFARRIITPEFKEYKNDTLKVIPFYAKKARGLMVKFIAENQITAAEQIKNFTLGGYQFDENLSSQNNWIFTR